MSKSWITIPWRGAAYQVFSNSPNLWHRTVRLWLACQLLVLPQCALFAQRLQLSTAVASGGEEVAIQLSLVSPDGKTPLALQWDTSVPVALDIVDWAIPKGSAVEGLGKTLTCAAAERSAEKIPSRCILAGGQKPIPDGPVAILRLRISRDVQAGSARIRLDQGIAASRDLKQVPLGPVETAVTIRQ